MKDFNRLKIKLHSFALGLGVISILVSIIIVYTVYTISIKRAETNLYQFYTAEAQFLQTIIEINKDKSEKAILQLIEQAYELEDNRPADEYVCIIDQNSTLVLHTMSPQTLGSNIGRNLIIKTKKEISSLNDLVSNKLNFTGNYISSSGQNQIAAFVYAPSTKWTIGVHRSKEKLYDEFKSQYFWIVIAFFIIIGMVLPLSLVLLFLASRTSFRKQIAVELQRIEDLNIYSIQLKEAKEKAEESDRLKSAFLANMSHEIRTPMNGILGFTQLLKESNLTHEEQQDFIRVIEKSGERMLNTLNDIVDFSKIESGITKVDIKETNINKQIEFIYKFFKPEVESKGITFSVKNNLPAKEAIINTDNEKVYGILTNLVKNAIKFTDEGSIEIGYEKKGEYLEFYVKDTGVGIPKKNMGIIFERFRIGSESLDRLYEGSGLGLSISKSYIEMLGGKIWVESVEGKGSTFFFTFPYHPVKEVKTEINGVDSSEIKEVQMKNLKILIVEDDEISYSLLSKTLQKISKEVLPAITGVQAVEACRTNPDLDLILMDIRMPVMNGIEATRQIRQFNKDVIIIAQTAYAFTGDSEMAIEAGCNDYISKPINKTLLYELINKHIYK